MYIFRENNENKLQKIDYKHIHFKAEVKNENNIFWMHKHFIINRNIIFGEYIYLLHEVVLSSESSIDFVGFTESGAVLLIELKRGEDSRNRQEVLSQIGKYASDSFSINNIINNEALIKEMLQDEELLNKPFPDNLFSKIQNNIKQNNINLFLITEDATDELLSSCYFFSYGHKNHKISIIELKRIINEEDTFCIINYYNKQPLLNNSRKQPDNLWDKIKTISNEYLRNIISDQINKWLDDGYNISPQTAANPEFISFYWEKGQSTWVFYYLKEKKQQNFPKKIKENSVVVQIKDNEINVFKEIIKELQNYENYYQITPIKGKNINPYEMHCICITSLETKEIEDLFSIIHKIAQIRKELYFKE